MKVLITISSALCVRLSAKVLSRCCGATHQCLKMLNSGKVGLLKFSLSRAKRRDSLSPQSACGPITHKLNYLTIFAAPRHLAEELTNESLPKTTPHVVLFPKSDYAIQHTQASLASAASLQFNPAPKSLC